MNHFIGGRLRSHLACLLGLSLGLVVAAAPAAAAQSTDTPAEAAQAQEPAAVQSSCVRNTFKNFHDEGEPGTPPADYDGPLFSLSQDYPDELPQGEDYPWLSVDVDTLGTSAGALRYLDAVFAYSTEGNIENDWVVQNNPVRDWYHAPWLDATLDGREFIHGLTHELDSDPGLLGPQQVDTAQTWAVGAYNAAGGWALGQLWCDPDNPDPNRINPVVGAPNSFPDGTAVWKLLFTTADDKNAPYLEGSFTWTANIFPKPLPPNVSDPNNPANQGDPPRTDKQVRLIQMDVAVRDDRLPLGWAFGTFAYFADATGDTPFEKLVPVGLQWGNDPGVTPNMVAAGSALTQTWINQDLVDDPRYPDIHLGWAGRLSGPLDNPASSCMSCHATAGSPGAPLVAEAAAWFTEDPSTGLAPDRSRLVWFNNVPSGVTFSDTQRESVDYSLQTAIGLQRFYLANCDTKVLSETVSARGPSVAAPAVVAQSTCTELANTVVVASSSATVSQRTMLIVTALALIVGVVAGTLLRKRRPDDKGTDNKATDDKQQTTKEQR